MLLLDAIATVETARRPVAGDHGAALSEFQIHRAVWQDVHRRWGAVKGEGGIPRLDIGPKFTAIGGADITSRLRARNCATGQVVIIEEYLQRHKVATTAENIYACWNLGCTGFKRRHFNLAECPAKTVAVARAVARLADQHFRRQRRPRSPAKASFKKWRSQPFCAACGVPFEHHAGLQCTCLDLQLTRLEQLRVQVDQAELRKLRALHLLATLCLLKDGEAVTTRNLVAALMRCRRRRAA